MIADAASATAVIDQALPAMRGMRIRITELGPGHVVAEIPLEGNANHLGTVCAGSMFSMAEMLGGAITFPSLDLAKFYPVVKDLKIDFRAPATTAVVAHAQLAPGTLDRVFADAEATGKGEFVLDAELVDTTGRVVATTQGTYQVRRHTEHAQSAVVA